jgi:uncharacterized protein (TIGR03083 family)
VDYEDYFDVITAHAHALANVARDAEPSEPVPSCPGWDVAKLVRHTGTTHRWASGIVRTRRPLAPKSMDLELPDHPSGLGDWLEEGAAGVVASLAEADPDAECWTWADQHHVRFWSRRMAHETAVHRWDGQAVTGAAEPFDATLAADGIDEHLENLPSVLGPDGAVGTGETLHLHCTDVPGEWLLRLGPDGLEVRREPSEGDTALEGEASDLFLAVLGRVSPGQVESFGNPAGLERWERMLHF